MSEWLVCAAICAIGVAIGSWGYPIRAIVWDIVDLYIFVMIYQDGFLSWCGIVYRAHTLAMHVFDAMLPLNGLLVLFWEWFNEPPETRSRASHSSSQSIVMAPFIDERPREQIVEAPMKRLPSISKPSVSSYQPGVTQIEKHDNYEYEDLMPHYPDVKWPALEEVPYEDKGLLGDPDFKHLKEIATHIQDYNPKIGTEVSGVDLANLTDEQKNDIARLISIRGVVFFRNQKNLDINAQRKLGAYFGMLHKHATTCSPKRGDLEDVHVIWADEKSKDQRAMFTPTFLWHSDVTYEIQPPSYTSLKILTGPPIGGGGDTLWSSNYAAYDLVSAPMQAYLESLTALHSAEMQASGSYAAGRPVRRDPVTTEHPLVRTHPVTGWKSLFFNPGFVTKIVGVPKVESDMIVNYLNELVATTQEIHVRFQWEKDDVAFWDNRIVNHTASYGFAPHRRHAVRVAATAERPYLDKESGSQEEEYARIHGLPKLNKDGSGQSNYND